VDLRKVPVFSRKAGKWFAETGSQLTACTATTLFADVPDRSLNQTLIAPFGPFRLGE
jgi:hypothetical protein